MEPGDPRYEAMKGDWTDKLVEVDPDRPELKRFAGLVGRVITVNCNLKAVVDFADGGWYDITPRYLRVVTDEAARKKYDPKANSAQPIPEKQS
jgi:hypothetical protein